MGSTIELVSALPSVKTLPTAWREIYCVAWVNTPPLGAQYLSRYPVRLRRGGLHFTASLTKRKIRKRDRVRPVGLKGKKVLVTTTTQETFDLLNHELLRAGMVVHQESWDNLPIFLTTPAGQRFDLGIIDFGKSIKQTSPDFGVIMGTLSPKEFPFEWIACAVPFPGIAQGFKTAGFKGFLSKPFRKKPYWKWPAMSWE